METLSSRCLGVPELVCRLHDIQLARQHRGRGRPMDCYRDGDCREQHDRQAKRPRHLQTPNRRPQDTTALESMPNSRNSIPYSKLLAIRSRNRVKRYPPGLSTEFGGFIRYLISSPCDRAMATT